MYPPHAFEHELDIACRAALAAGRALTEFRYRPPSDRQPNDALSAQPARISEQVVRTIILAAFQCDALLCESSQDAAERVDARRVWIVDALDGEREFATGHGEYSVMIALLQDEALRVGVVYRPVRDVLYYAVAGAGAYRSNGHGPEPLACVPSKNGVHVLGAHSADDPIVRQLCKDDGFTDVDAGAAVGVQCARIAEGAADLYVQPEASLAEWNTAAPELIVTEAGGCVTDCLGRALTYNKEIPRQSTGILAAHPAVTFRVIPTLARMLTAK